jgi:hypothetical protein
MYPHPSRALLIPLARRAALMGFSLSVQSIQRVSSVNHDIWRIRRGVWPHRSQLSTLKNESLMVLLYHCFKIWQAEKTRAVFVTKGFASTALDGTVSFYPRFTWFTANPLTFESDGV